MESQIALSENEGAYILAGIQCNTRGDGRGRGIHRPITVESRVVSGAAGSVKLRIDGTHVLCAVKMQVDAPKPGSENKGNIEFFVDCSGAASPAFAGRGGEHLAMELAQMLRRISAHESAFDATRLCIVPGRKVWTLFVDILVLECSGGNLFDTVALAARAALATTKIPNWTLVMDEEGKPEDFELSDDPSDVRTLGTDLFPVLVTLTKVGRYHVVDATAEEEACSDAQVMVGVNRNGDMCGMCKYGRGAINPALLAEMTKQARDTGMALIADLDVALKEEEKLGANIRVGFLA